MSRTILILIIIIIIAVITITVDTLTAHAVRALGCTFLTVDAVSQLRVSDRVDAASEACLPLPADAGA